MVLNWLKNKATDNRGLSALWSGNSGGTASGGAGLGSTARNVAGSGFTRSKMAPSRAKQFLNQWAGPLIGGLLGAPFGVPGIATGSLLGGAYTTDAAQKARTDPYRGPFEFGLSEGLGSILSGKGNRDSVGLGKAAGEAGVGSALGGVGSAVGARAGDFLSRMDVKDNWIADTAGSPAAKAGFDPDDRFQLQLKHQQWLKDRGRRYDTSFDSWLR